MAIYFYNIRDEYGCFSNFSRHGFELNGQYWPTSEHYFQAQKFAGTPYEEFIRKAPSPREAANMGRDRKKPLRKDWEKVKDEIMLCALRKKFEIHKDIRDILLSTGEEELVEETTDDYYWGCGKEGHGKNMLGHLLMKIREEFRLSGQ